MSDACCPLCGHKKTRLLFQESGYDLLQCNQCDLFFIHPYPQEAEKVYQTVANYSYDDLEILDCDRHYQSSLRYTDYLYEMLRDEYKGAHSALDVGCGTGRLLELLAEYPKLTRIGIELNRARARFSQEKARCEVHTIPVEEFESESPFDVISLMNLLAHVPNVVNFVMALRPLLVAQGKVIVKVNEMTSNVQRKAVYDWQIPDHLQFYGMRTMDELAQKTGFQIVRHDRVPMGELRFAPWRWRIPGRSRMRNRVKTVVSSVPLLLPLLKKIYEAKYGGSVFSSLIVMVKRDME